MTRRRAALLALAASLTLAVTACTAPDTVTRGDRPNSPGTIVQPTVNPETDPAKLSIPLDSLPSFRAGTKGADGWTSNPMTGSGGDFSWRVVGADDQPIQDYLPQESVAFGDPATYTTVPGVLTFRGNNARNAPAYGTAEVTEKKLEVVWTQDIGEIKGHDSVWPGAGWTGQPLLVNWPEQSRRAMGFAPEFADKNLVEVIYPVFEGKVYRLDLETGKQTRPPMEGTGGFKGTGSIDPRGYPLLYSGQGLEDINGNHVGWRYRIFDLIQNKEISGWTGSDPTAPRKDWGAFDSSALVNAASDTLIEPAENGLIYKVKLNAAFDPAARTVSVNPQLTKLEYRTPASAKHGIESSAVAYRNLMFASDNDGNLICWDANTLTVLWARDIGDDSDATMVLEENPEGVFLYHGNTLDKRGEKGDKHTNLRKINALTGELVWQYDIATYYDQTINGGLLATPLLGRGEISDLVIFNVSKTSGAKAGTMVALDKKTGKMAWERQMGRYSWSSPVAVTGTDGHQYGLFADSGGLLHLFNPNTGEDYSTVSLGKNTEATPSVYGNMIVVASYAQKIWGIRIR